MLVDVGSKKSNDGKQVILVGDIMGNSDNIAVSWRVNYDNHQKSCIDQNDRPSTILAANDALQLTIMNYLQVGSTNIN